MDSPTSKTKYKARLASAIEWIQESPTEKAVNDAINKAKKALNRRGINTCNVERDYKKAIAEFNEQFIRMELLSSIVAG